MGSGCVGSTHQAQPAQRRVNLILGADGNPPCGSGLALDLSQHPRHWPLRGVRRARHRHRAGPLPVLLVLQGVPTMGRLSFKPSLGTPPAHIARCRVGLGTCSRQLLRSACCRQVTATLVCVASRRELAEERAPWAGGAGRRRHVLAHELRRLVSAAAKPLPQTNCVSS